ncbi:hypothetical protein Moror_13769 [Moniliophthora roreri MCA 2997]|uniref:Uncharacterized protein n=1 Tax=Moniliophthora roreri (strain MCA 2997) TaxID=1381753 RepID=V2XCW7_MONRO|nr:hypothetical protein Moror_13769 [Moniliophthora roreri MCA 2997]
MLDTRRVVTLIGPKLLSPHPFYTQTMETMLSAFKLKPFDLEPIYKSWQDGPKFTGNPKKDPPVDEWLAQIKAGCIERNVPREYWHKVGQHFMREKAKARLDELRAVMAKVHGGTYRWSWEKFKIAMRNLGWNIEDSETESIKVKSKPSGLWWIHRDKNEKVEQPPSPVQGIHAPAASASTPPKPTPKRSNSSFWLSRKPTMEKGNENAVNGKEKQATTDSSSNITPSRPPPTRSGSGFWLARRASREETFTEEPLPIQHHRPNTSKSKSDTRIVTVREPPKPSMPVRKDSTDEAVTTVTHAPIWLINACNALDFLQTEHPKVMSTISAILITAGTLPTIPAISAGAGGALLASGAAQAAGAIAVGVGSWLKAQQEARTGSGSTTPPEK